MNTCSTQQQTIIANISSNETYLTTNDLVNDSKLSKSFFKKKRVTGGGPPFIHIGRAVRYPQSHYQQWLADHTLLYSTSQADLCAQAEQENA